MTITICWCKSVPEHHTLYMKELGTKPQTSTLSETGYPTIVYNYVLLRFSCDCLDPSMKTRRRYWYPSYVGPIGYREVGSGTLLCVPCLYDVD